MNPMTGEETRLQGSGSPGTGGMRIVMVNARTAVLVPADTPDPEAADDTAGWTDDTEAATVDDAGGDADDLPEPAAASSEDDADMMDDTPGTDDIGAEQDHGPDLSAVPDDPGRVEPDPLTAAPLATAGTSGPSTQGDDGGPGEGTPQWRDQLLSRLDDLGRLLSRALPTADESIAPLAATLERLEQRMASAMSGIEGRLDRLEQTVGEGMTGPGASGAETDEAISDLRMQLRMLEVQVGALGRLLVTGGTDDTTGPDAMRTRLAELVAREQQLATGS